MAQGDSVRIVVVGGGAGGLELATRLGNRLGRRGQAEITLIDSALTHLWKPLLHEVAAGTLDSHNDDLDYLAQARWNNFTFRLGRMEGLDRTLRLVHVAATRDKTDRVIVPARSIPYDILVLAVGSITNDFGIEGVREHCTFLDDRKQADGFQRRLLENYIRAQTQTTPLREGQMTTVIVGAGATGVELAAELHHVAHQLVAYGLDHALLEQNVKFVIVEAAPRILPVLPERLVAPAETELRRLNIEIHTHKRVTKITSTGVHTQDGMFIPAEMRVWAAGIKAPDFLQNLDGLETNRLNQLVVRTTLQTTRDNNIFAIGDCAACTYSRSGLSVPPTAQAAHQQASLLLKSIQRHMHGQLLPKFSYRDRGSLVSLSQYTAVGNLMGNLLGSVYLEGFIARVFYRLLYRLHQRALYGTTRTLLITLADMLTRSTQPRMKLH